MDASAIRPLDDHSRALLRSGVLTPSLPSALVELVENALDAGATSVDVQVDPQAWSLRVVDDGCGIPFETLCRLGATLRSGQGGSTAGGASGPTTPSRGGLLPDRPVAGRRGAALTAIAALSLLHVISRTAGSPHAGEVILRGGELISTGKTHALTASRPGTSVSVRDLFYNLPVRRSAHRDAHEDRVLAECKELIEQTAVANPSCAFKLRRSATGGGSPDAQRLVIAHIPKTDDPWGTFCRLFDVRNQETPIELAADGISLICYVGTSPVQRQLVYVDGRAVHKTSTVYKILRHARTGSKSPAKGAASSRSPDYRRCTGGPSCLVLVRSLRSSARHDVEDARVTRLVEACARQMRIIGETGRASPATGSSARETAKSTPQRSRHHQQPLRSLSGSASRVVCPETPSRSTCDGTNLQPTGTDALRSLDAERSFGAACSSGPSIFECCGITPFGTQGSPSARSLSRETLQASVYVGQVDNKFLLCKTSETSTDLFLVDQHAAHERVRFEHLLDDLFSERTQSVKLPKPVGVVLQADPSRRQLAAALDDLQAWGFACCHTGSAERQMWVSAVPDALWDRLAAHDDLTRLIVLSAVQSKGSKGNIAQAAPVDAAPSWVQAMARCPPVLIGAVQSIACRGAIMFGDPLAEGEATALLAALARSVFPMICAHGRPSIHPLPSLGGHADEAAVRWDGL